MSFDDVTCQAVLKLFVEHATCRDLKTEPKDFGEKYY